MKKFILVIGFLIFLLPLRAQIINVTPVMRVHVSEEGGSTLLEDILAYWNLNEASGNAIDQPGSADLTATGATQHVAGKLSYAVSFDGTNDFLGSIDATFELQTFSVAVWVKTTAATNDYYAVVDNRQWDGGAGGNPGGWSVCTSFAFDSEGGVRVMLCDGTNDIDIYKTPGCAVVNDGNWHLIIFTFAGGSGGAYALYVDNSTEASGTWNHTLAYSSDNRFTLGSSSNGSELFFPGTIDEGGIWTRILSSDERTTLWNGGSGITYPFE